MDDDLIDTAAQVLLLRAHAGRAGPRLIQPQRPQQPLEGWRIQRRVSTLRNTPVIGWKCGLSPPDRWVAAALHEAIPAGGRVRAPAGPTGAPRIEPELAFELAYALPVRSWPYTAEEVEAAIGGVRLAVEVLGCRYEDAADASGPELMADSLWHQALVLGPHVTGLAREPSFTLTVAADGQPELAVQARHPDGDPRRPLFWLAEFLRQQGTGLEAGQVVITGSLAGVIELPFARPCVLRYGEFGELSLNIDPL